MEKDYLHLDLPVFEPGYEDGVRYSWSNDIEKKRLRNLLCRTTNGYCMYCYTRVEVDGKISADIEHGVEKNLNDKLIDCLPNLGLSCKVCNQSTKRKGEFKKKEKIPEELQLVIESFREQECNTPALCRAACDGYMNLRDCYSKYRNIVLQPIVSAQKKSLIQYDVLKRRFVPSVCLDNEFAKLIQAHIDKFGLNDSKCRTMELIRFCKDVVDGVVKPIKGRYNNLIVDLFVDKIFGMEEKKYKAICKVILAQAAYKQDWVSINDC